VVVMVRHSRCRDCPDAVWLADVGRSGNISVLQYLPVVRVSRFAIVRGDMVAGLILAFIHFVVLVAGLASRSWIRL
jgi:hypothetical protein